MYTKASASTAGNGSSTSGERAIQLTVMCLTYILLPLLLLLLMAAAVVLLVFSRTRARTHVQQRRRRQLNSCSNFTHKYTAHGAATAAAAGVLLFEKLFCQVRRALYPAAAAAAAVRLKLL